jgi:glycosyltransferase involved in cell wall biosynthesis
MIKLEKKKVSIMIPTYNYAYLIKDAIDSILSQTYHNLELIICDDCSDDNTEEVVKNYHDPRIRFYRNETRLGLYGNFNHSRHYATGEYLLFLCADDALSPESLERMVINLDSFPSAALATTYQRQSIDAAGNKIEDVFIKKLGPGLIRGEEIIKAQCCYTGSVGRPSEVLIRAEYLHDGDTFDRSVEHCADNALWCNLCKKWDIVYVDGALAYIRFHKKQATIYHMGILLDIKDDHEMFVRLFRDSLFLKNNPVYKYIFVKNRLYPWFVRAIKELSHGDMKKGFWILRQIATFSKIPWWVPYFAWLHIKGKIGSKLRKSIYVN